MFLSGMRSGKISISEGCGIIESIFDDFSWEWEVLGIMNDGYGRFYI